MSDQQSCNFWQTVEKPIFILAPMEDVTDTVLRQVIARCGKPAVFFTEFTNVEGMLSKGAQHVLHRLQYTDIEKPLVAQIWGSQPENFCKAAKYIREVGINAVDLNMGCPASGPVGRGVCSGLMNNRSHAKEIIDATKEGAAGLIPVSVKTRLGFRTMDVDWLQFVLGQKPAVLTVHLRTVSEMSRVPAHWDRLKMVVEMRDAISPETLIVGNGDIKSLPEARQRVAEAGADGAMIGRGIFENPYLFADVTIHDKTPAEKMHLLLDHVHLWQETWGTRKHFPTLRKFFKVYANGFPGAQDLRMQLMETATPEETEQVVRVFLQTLPFSASKS